MAVLAPFSEAELEALEWDWRFWARPEQIAPDGDWNTWLILAGRGFGKTRSGAEWVRETVNSGKVRNIALVAETQKDLEDVMVFGASGIANVFPDHQRPTITRKPIRVTFHNGAQAFGYNGTEPDQLRGPQFGAAWLDEFAKYRYAQEIWDQLSFTLREGVHPRALITTTPRPVPVLKDIIADPSTTVTRGRTADNRANLPARFLEAVHRKHEGTRLGRQELEAEILDDLPDALWPRELLDQCKHRGALPEMKRIVVAVDPSGTKGKDAAKTEDMALGDDIGISVAGIGLDDIGYILADRTCNLSPDGWGNVAARAYHEFGADMIVAERNFGGAMVEHVIRTVDRNVPFKEVVASRGKIVRAEPVAALYEQHRVRHAGALSELEDQLADFSRSEGYIGRGSPDRADAAIWAITELMLDGSIYDIGAF